MSLEKRGLSRPIPPAQGQLGSQIAVLHLTDGTRIEGALGVQPGVKLMDHLNHQSDKFIAITDATITYPDRQLTVSFLAVNKDQIATMFEQPLGS